MIRNTIFGKWYKHNIHKWIPAYALLSLIACFSFNSFVYWGTQILGKNVYHYDLTSSLDRKVPFMKEWAVIYVVCYLFWVFNYILISRESKEKWYRFASADIMSRIICGIIFILIPTTNIRPQVLGNDAFSQLVRFVYHTDAPTNLFPSIHCLVSWYCFVGIRKSKKIPLWYKIFSCIFALLVCASTQFIKQHYLIDIAGGVLIAELCFYITHHTNFYLVIERFFDWIGQKIFGANYYDE
ncbi:phosphatase PAP2 family protein [Anaeromicropila herbilytica]|uniref:phosphatase PAP2 family protein n=1 Tax=Anaeromicropila herbilytica TaxID=2785025 RepID=UPI00232A55D1|nr:phosphatase PAP2 family protein [Anaeromicropila herbilytica]